MKRKFILILMAVTALGMSACSSASKEGAGSVSADSRQETGQEETADAKAADTETADMETKETEKKDMEQSKPKSTEEDGTDRQETEEIGDIPQGDPIVGIVDAYDGSTITVRTPEDDMLYRFSAEDVPVLEGYSTEQAHAADEDFSIAVGDKVEVSYRGLLDDKERPIDAVKIVVVPVE